jgi:cyclophilin family peptidyl-prolyl cis-trans isomerase
VRSDESFARLVDAELRRAAADAPLHDALNGEGELAARASWSLARIGGPQARAALGDWLTGQVDDERVPRLAAALALLEPVPGDPVWTHIEDGLWRRYAVTEDAEAGEALLFAIARVGGAPSIDRFAVELAPRISGPEPGARLSRRVAALEALGVLCARGIPVNASARDALAQSLDATRGEEVSAAAYALGRCARVSSETLAVAEERKVLVARLTRSMGTDAEFDRLAWIALRALGDLPDPLPTDVLSTEPPPWSTEVEAVRAFAQTAAGRTALLERVLALGPEAFAGPRTHVMRVALQSLRPHVGRKMLTGAAKVEQLVSAVDEAQGRAKDRERKAIALLRCEARTLAAISSGDLAEIERCRDADAGIEATSAYEVEALLHMSDTAMERRARVDALLSRAASPRSEVSAPALAALAEISDPRAVEALGAALGRDDPGVVAAAAGALAARSVDAGKRQHDVVPALRRTVNELKNGDAVEARLMAIEALGVLANTPKAGVDPESKRKPEKIEAPWLESVILPLARDPSIAIRAAARKALRERPELLRRFDETGPVAGRDAFAGELEARLRAWADQPVDGLRVSTEAGAFVVDLRGYDVPMNHASLVGLAREGYYEGVKIHRVEPGFVIQGGDPRGDGYGGPGYLVPCERSNHRYERGSVGIALAGKDTGGSQWFVVQTPQPHLDGRYTQIGTVIEGMEVIDAVLPGDQILSIEPISNLPS